eukprot:s4014_g2.t1
MIQPNSASGCRSIPSDLDSDPKQRKMMLIEVGGAASFGSTKAGGCVLPFFFEDVHWFSMVLGRIKNGRNGETVFKKGRVLPPWCATVRFWCGSAMLDLPDVLDAFCLPTNEATDDFCPKLAAMLEGQRMEWDELPPECDEGCVEYKWRLGPEHTHRRLERLSTQMKFRLTEGGGETDQGNNDGMPKRRTCDKYPPPYKQLAYKSRETESWQVLGSRHFNIRSVTRLASDPMSDLNALGLEAPSQRLLDRVSEGALDSPAPIFVPRWNRPAHPALGGNRAEQGDDVGGAGHPGEGPAGDNGVAPLLPAEGSGAGARPDDPPALQPGDSGGADANQTAKEGKEGKDSGASGQP